LKGRRPRPG